jgi:hypothetical protein
MSLAGQALLSSHTAVAVRPVIIRTQLNQIVPKLQSPTVLLSQVPAQPLVLRVLKDFIYLQVLAQLVLVLVVIQVQQHAVAQPLLLLYYQASTLPPVALLHTVSVQQLMASLLVDALNVIHQETMFALPALLAAGLTESPLSQADA